MADFKDIDLSKFSLDLTKTMQHVNPIQDHMARMQRGQEQTIRSIQKAKEEKEAEELRRHNELVAALKEAGEKGATIIIGDNANGIQIQQNSDGAMQEMTNSQTFNYDKALEVLKEIKEYIDFPQFQTTFKENSENVKAIIEDTIKAVENKDADLGLITNPHFFKKVQTIPLFEEQLVFVCGEDAPYQDGLLPSQLDSADEIYIPWSNTFLMWHDYWFGNDPKVKVMLDNMALLRQLLDLKNAWAIMPATLGRKLAEKENCRIVSIENGPEYRTCYAIMNDQRSEHPLIDDFLNELLKTVGNIPEIRLLDLTFRRKNP